MILFNNYYEEDERLFSTGDSDLDDLLEEVYYSGISDGYDYAQKEFTSNREVKKAMSHASREARKALRKNGNKLRNEIARGNREGATDIIFGAKVKGVQRAENTKPWKLLEKQVNNHKLSESARKGAENQRRKLNKLADKYGYGAF